MNMPGKFSELFFYVILGLLPLQIGVNTSLAAEAGLLTVPEHNISIEFDLQSNVLMANSRIILPAGLSLHLDLSSLNVSQVILNGQQAEPAPDTTYLDIPASQKEQEILISYRKEIQPGSSPYNMISGAGITLIDSWFPVADHDMFFRLTAGIPLEFEAVSEADEIISLAGSDTKQVTFRFPHPLFSINFIAGPYVVARESFGEEKTLYSYFFPEDQELAADYLAKAEKYLARYEEMLGPYPYARFSIVENRLPTGFAMPTFTLLGQSVVRLPFIVDTSLGHEIVHFIHLVYHCNLYLE